MTFIPGGNIQASDYNGFATNLNRIYSDFNSGATTLPAAGYGYGQSGALVPVVVGNNVTATQWETMRQRSISLGAHQGTTVIPPLQATPYAPGETVTTFNLTPLTALDTNRHNLAPGQTALNLGTTYSSTNTWLTLMTYTARVNFSSWNNARYFFNSGGSLQIVGSYPTATTPIELAWKDALENRSPIVFNWNSTTAASGSNNAPLNPIGFWNTATNNPLTTSYQVIYYKAIGAGYYTSSFVQIEARLANAAGTDGQMDIRLSLIDGDPTPSVKASGIGFTINNAASASAIVYPGPPVIVTSTGFTYA